MWNRMILFTSCRERLGNRTPNSDANVAKKEKQKSLKKFLTNKNRFDKIQKLLRENEASKQKNIDN